MFVILHDKGMDKVIDYRKESTEYKPPKFIDNFNY